MSKTDETQVIRTEPQSTLALIAQATMSKDVDPEKLRALLDVQQTWEAGEARKEFASAIAAFQKAAPIIDKGDTANGRPYARMDRIWRTIKPLLGDLGLWVTWQSAIIEDGMCKIRGTLGHQSGHTVELANDIPLPDVLKAQNQSQRAGSAQTYAKRQALCAALGIVTGEDDDGGAASEPITDKQCSTILDWIVATDTDTATFCEWLKIDCIESMPDTRYEEALAALKRKQAVQQKKEKEGLGI